MACGISRNTGILTEQNYISHSLLRYPLQQPTIVNIYTVSTKSNPNVFTKTLKVVNIFPSKLAHKVSDNFLTPRHKNAPFQIMQESTPPCKVMRDKTVIKK